MSSEHRGPVPPDAAGDLDGGLSAGLAAGLEQASVRRQLSAVADAVLGRDKDNARVELALVETGARQPGSGPVDLVWAGPDDLPRLVAAGTLPDALRAARGALRPGGLVVLAAAGADALAALHAADTTVHDDGTHRVTAWEPTGGAGYDRHDLALRLTAGGWTCEAAEPVPHRVPEPDEVSGALEAAGFWSPQLLGTSETGLAVAVWAAVAPGEGEAAPARDEPAGAGLATG